MKITSHNKRAREKLFSTSIDRNRRRRNRFVDRFEKFSQTGFFDYFFRCNKRADFATTTNFVAGRMIVDSDINYCNRRQVASDIVADF